MSARPRRLPACALSALAFLLASCSNSNPVAPARPVAPTVQIYSGTYTLTITASEAAGPCAPTFPSAARRRLYVARVQDGVVSGNDRLEVFLSGADFIIKQGRGNAFSGTVRATGEIDFTIHDAYPGDPWWPWPSDADVVERLSDGTQLVVVAEITARRTGSTISGQGGVLNHSSGGQCAIESFEMVRT